jgi:Fur family transcriptional regulator, ferric uptake regulator
VVEVLVDAAPDHHVTADQLIALVGQRHPEIHRATIYRTLDVLLEAGVITHVHLGHGPATFHLPGRAHHHAVCNGCGGSVELPHHTLDAVNQYLATEHGWRLTTQHFALSAVCPTCQTL